MSLNLRNVNEENKVQERFIGFINCRDSVYNKYNNIDNIESSTIYGKCKAKIPGKILGNTLLNVLKKMSLNLKYCIGIGTDRCAIMIFKTRGGVQNI